MYGFRKLTALLQGTLEDSHEAVEFFHPLFLRDNPELMEHIKRKVSHPGSKLDIAELSQVLEDVHEVKTTQLNISSQLSELRRENEDLWREVVTLRQKHTHQQKVVNRLIQFLVSLVQHHGSSMKRTLPLMIEGGSDSSQPFTKMKKGSSGQVEVTSEQVSPPPVDSRSINSGPLITELWPNKSARPPSADVTTSNEPIVHMDDNDFDISSLIDSDLSGKSSKSNAESEQPLVTLDTSVLPESVAAADQYLVKDVIDDTSGNQEDTTGVLSLSRTPAVLSATSTKPLSTAGLAANDESSAGQLALTSSHMPPSPQAITSTIDVIQNNLNSIQRRLSNNEQIHLDYDLIRELFNSSVDITPPPQALDPHATSTGTELVQYTGGPMNTPNDKSLESSQESLDDVLNLLSN